MKVNSMGQKWVWWLVLIGALNWGLVGVGYFVKTNLNLVNLLLGTWPLVENLVYLVIGGCALWLAFVSMNRKP